MLVAKLPGSIYATQAIKAGPINGSSRASKPFLLCPCSTSIAELTVPTSPARMGSSTLAMVAPYVEFECLLCKSGSFAFGPGLDRHDENGLCQFWSDIQFFSADAQADRALERRALQDRERHLRTQPQFGQIAQALGILVAYPAHDRRPSNQGLLGERLVTPFVHLALTRWNRVAVRVVRRLAQRCGDLVFERF